MSEIEEQRPEAVQTPPKPDRHELKREIIDFVKLVVWFLIIFLGLKTYVIEGYEVQGPSMIPTLQNNERILVLKLPHILSQVSFFGFAPFDSLSPIEAGDIVVFDSPDTPDKRYVKRVIAMGPPDTPGKIVDATSGDDGQGLSAAAEGVIVEFDRGQVYVNNRKVLEPYIEADAQSTSDVHGPSVLGPGEYYVLGDNRPVSKDSRSFDSISGDKIIGKAVLRFWPPHKISLVR